VLDGLRSFIEYPSHNCLTYTLMTCITNTAASKAKCRKSAAQIPAGGVVSLQEDIAKANPRSTEAAAVKDLQAGLDKSAHRRSYFLSTYTGEHETKQKSIGLCLRAG
jgi:hypothetical protein